MKSVSGENVSFGNWLVAESEEGTENLREASLCQALAGPALCFWGIPVSGPQ